jgi:hypothetical protein
MRGLETIYDLYQNDMLTVYRNPECDAYTILCARGAQNRKSAQSALPHNHDQSFMWAKAKGDSACP